MRSARCIWLGMGRRRPPHRRRSPARQSDAAEAWGANKDTTNIAMLEAFVTRYKDTFFAELARARIEELKKQIAAAAPPTTKPAPTQIIAPAGTFFKRQTRGQSLVAEGPLVGAAIRDPSGAQLGTVEALILEESETVGLLFSYNGKHVALPIKSPYVSSDPAGQSVRLDVADAAAMLSSLEPYQKRATPESDKIALVRSLQRELKRVGCDPGALDGRWSDKPRSALREFAKRAKVALAGDDPTKEALDAVSSAKDRVCPLLCKSGETQVDGKCASNPPPLVSPPTTRKTDATQSSQSEACSKCATCRRMNAYTGENSVQMERCIRVCKNC